MPEYIIKAHSKSRNQTQRQVNLLAGDPQTKRLAEQTARAFADTLNQRTNGIKDWVGQIELVEDRHFRTQ
jgi:hypothetical protein